MANLYAIAAILQECRVLGRQALGTAASWAVAPAWTIDRHGNTLQEKPRYVDHPDPDIFENIIAAASPSRVQL